MQNQTRNLVIVALVAALVAVTCWKQSPGQGEAPRPAAATPEYMVVRLGDHEDVASSALREYSQQRWKSVPLIAAARWRTAFSAGPRPQSDDAHFDQIVGVPRTVGCLTLAVYWEAR